MGEIDNDISALQFPCSLKELVNMTKIEFKTKGKNSKSSVKWGGSFTTRRDNERLESSIFIKKLRHCLRPLFSLIAQTRLRNIP